MSKTLVTFAFGMKVRQTLYLATAAIIITRVSVASTGSRADSLVARLEQATPNEQPDILRSLAAYYYYADSANLAYEYAGKSVSLAEENEDLTRVAKGKNMLGYIYLYWDNFGLSLESFLSAYRFGVQLDDEELQSVSLHGMARNYTYLGNYPRALECNQKGLEISRKHGWDNTVNGFLNNMAEYFKEQAQYDSAVVYLEQYYSNAVSSNDKRSIIYALNNIGEAHLNRKNFPLSMHYLKMAQQANDSLGDLQASASITGNMALVYLGTGELDKALSNLLESNRIAGGQGMQRILLDNYKSLADLYAMKTDYKEALRYSNLYIELKDGLLGQKRQREINELIRNYDTAESSRKEALLLQKHRNQRIWLMLFVLLVVVASIAIVMLVYGYRLRIRLHKRKSLELTEVVDKRNRELTSALLYNSRVRDAFNQANEVVSHLGKEASMDDKLREQIEQLKKILGTSDTEEEWEAIQLHFSEIHPDFFKRLREMSTELTQYDLKHCAYIKMNLSTKDISRILNISDRSVQTARYRIKKKLGLDPGTDLTRMLQDI
jgi:hypothetical protein